jgi:hypothetical protein
MYIAHEKKKLLAVYQLTERFQDKMQQVMTKCRKLETYDDMLPVIAEELSNGCFRLYICDENGFQKSSNYVKKNEDWILEPEYVKKNWSWRPYFLENIIRMSYEKKGILSDLYNDIETGENIRTFSYPIDNMHYIFLDISYSFLYERDVL